MTNLLVKLAGPSYKTTITGCAEALAATFFGLAVCPYELGDVSTVIDPSWKPFFFKAAGICYVISRVLNAIWTKATNVSGNTATGQTVSDSKGEYVVAVPPKNENAE